MKNVSLRAKMYRYVSVYKGKAYICPTCRFGRYVNTNQIKSVSHNQKFPRIKTYQSFTSKCFYTILAM